MPNTPAATNDPSRPTLPSDAGIEVRSFAPASKPYVRPGAVAGRDVAQAREARRRRRVGLLAVTLVLIIAAITIRLIVAGPMPWIWQLMPSVDPMYLMSGTFFFVLILSLVGSTVVSGRSPHIVFRPEQMDVRMSDVKGLAPITEDVRRSLDLFLNARTFQREMGGRARRGLLFEGPPGTGKTHMAKAMAAEAGVPFLFVSATSFQSMMHGASARKIRSFFKALRKAARVEGGAIAFIEEIDAIAMARGGMATTGTEIGRATGSSALSCGGLTGLPGSSTINGAAGNAVINRNGMMHGGSEGLVNELLVQMQSFDTPTGAQRVKSWGIDKINLLLPVQRQLPRPRIAPVDVLVIAATNQAASLDPALLRPGRFDRRMVFGLPDKAGRRELIDHFLSRKSHESMLDGDEYRDALAGVTQGYSPVAIEHLMDEALINAVRRDAAGMNWGDLEHARMVTEVGLGQPVGYTEHEKKLIATHEAGHAVTAYLLAPQRRLEILTIIKRADALGLLAHGDRDDVYTRSRSELAALIAIAFGGQVAEELFFDDISTGPAGDLAYATTVAAQMIGSAGMEGTLVSFAAAPSGMFGGGDLVSRVMGDGDGRQMMESLLNRTKAEVRSLLAANRHLIEALRDALLERHELIGREIEQVLTEAEAARRAA